METSQKQHILLNEVGRKLYGNVLIKIVKTPLDPQFDNAAQQGLLNLNKKLFIFATEYIPVTSVEKVPGDANGKSYVMINGTPELRFEVTAAHATAQDILVKPTANAVKDALMMQDIENKPVYFVHCEEVTKIVMALNNANYEDVAGLATRLLDQAKLYPQMNEVEKNKCINTLKAIGEVPSFS